jgi:hypothetical protein
MSREPPASICSSRSSFRHVDCQPANFIAPLLRFSLRRTQSLRQEPNLNSTSGKCQKAIYMNHWVCNTSGFTLLDFCKHRQRAFGHFVYQRQSTRSLIFYDHAASIRLRAFVLNGFCSSSARSIFAPKALKRFLCFPIQGQF